jgi:enterobactin synthetase component D
MHYEITLRNALPHGVIAGVDLPGDGGEVPEEVLERLHPDERAFAEHLRGFRRCSYVGGRLAARGALYGLGRAKGPVLSDGRGAPVSPPGTSVSITHKAHRAVAIAARAELGTLGIDLEDLTPERAGIAARVLRPEELAAVEALAPDRRWTATVVRFSLKEAIYKALAPRLKRFIGFEEASVDPGVDGIAKVTLHLTEGPAPLALDARYTWLDQAVLSTVRARWTALPDDAPVD